MPRTKLSATARRPTLVSQDDGERTIDDWGKMKLVALRLKCNQYSLVETGNKRELQERLYSHFNPGRDSRESDSSSVETAPYEDEFDLQRALDSPDEDLLNDVLDGDDTQDDPRDGAPTLNDDTQQDDTQRDVNSAPDAGVLQQEIRALRSQIASMQRAAPQKVTTAGSKRRRKQKTAQIPTQPDTSIAWRNETPIVRIPPDYRDSETLRAGNPR